jgi:hypothetical protein
MAYIAYARKKSFTGLGNRPRYNREASTICRGCGELIVWMTTRNGKKLPVQLTSFTQGDTVYKQGVHQCHFDYCPARRLTVTKMSPRDMRGRDFGSEYI